MVGDFVRDKDAVTASLLACEMLAFAKANKTTAYNYLLNLYVKHGCYQERLVSLVKKGISGAQEIKQMMIDLRENPPTEIAGKKVAVIEDYQTGERHNKRLDKKELMDIPKANVLIFYLEDGSKIAARPSGTEPKIKFYMSVKDSLDHIDNYETVQDRLNQKLDAILKSLDIN
jgi:phosphoglucomutase